MNRTNKVCVSTTPMLMSLALQAVLSPLAVHAAEVLLPNLRSTYHVAEPIEVAVAGLESDTNAKCTFQRIADDAPAFSIDIPSDGSTQTIRLAPFSLAPGEYQINVTGAAQPTKLTVGHGVPRSTMFVTQVGNSQAGGNVEVTNAFGFGLLTPQGAPDVKPRRISGMMLAKEKLFAENKPDLIYMYWTGYVLHKPWGIHKEWCSPDMTENMRLFNFHVAQRMRRYDRNILMIGCIDEPGLPWGKTPAGGSATGFPGWNTAKWYEERGWTYANNPATGSDADWLKYMGIRSSMLGEQTKQANDDIKQVWPTVTFSSDLYAPQAPMDGTDPWNQRANDVPSTHVFADYGIGKLGVLGGLYLEKAHDPLSKVAHAMNGQLFGARVPQPQTRYAYHLMTNVLLAAGLRSNWWLNYGGMGPDDLVAVNEPAERLGPVFLEMNSTQHDVALLWSVREMAMRCKDVTAREARKKTGEQITLLVPDLPAEAETEGGEITISAYAVGGNYRGEILTAHTALSRAGYPAHIVHERLLPTGALRRYKTLVIIGQTIELPDDIMRAIKEFKAAGGKVVVDPSTKIKIDGAIVADVQIENQGYKWTSVFGLADDKQQPAEKLREKSYYQTNHYMESFSRAATEPLRKAMQQTDSRPVLVTSATDLACERHVGGQGQLVMVVNAHEQLPNIEPTERYFIWNYAPFNATYKLPTISNASKVFEIAGLDWCQVRQLESPAAEISGAFQPGEMKLYLAAPKLPEVLKLDTNYVAGRIDARVTLAGLRMPWPLEITLNDPKGVELLKIYRATNSDGQWVETLPIGASAAAGSYIVRVRSPVGELTAEQTFEIRQEPAAHQILDQPVRVLDKKTIQDFLAAKPDLTIAVGNAAQQAAAEKLAADLKAAGLKIEVKHEQHLYRKALYPRVWDPYVMVHKPAERDAALPSEEVVTAEATIESPTYDEPLVKNAAGETIPGDWRMPGTLFTVGPQGFIALDGPESFYAPGCKLFVTKNKRLHKVSAQPEEHQTTEEFRHKWSRPWSKVSHHVGGFNLTPELPAAYQTDRHLILLGDSTQGELVKALQASELLTQVADAKYPGPKKALIAFAWSPFALEKNVILIGASDAQGLANGAAKLVELAKAEKVSE